jgi:NitT/TauT family transport system permease protein
VNPFLSGLYAMPSIALLPWVSLIVGIDLTPKIIMAFLGAALPIAMSTLRGVAIVDHDLLTLGRSFLARRSIVIRDIIIPSVVPFMLTGLRIGLYGSLGFTLVAEFITSRAGLGHRIQEAGNTFQTDIAFAGIVIVIAIALVLWFAVGIIERYVLRWRAPV